MIFKGELQPKKQDIGGPHHLNDIFSFLQTASSLIFVHSLLDLASKTERKGSRSRESPLNHYLFHRMCLEKVGNKNKRNKWQTSGSPAPPYTIGI